jgi:hypothetical protein
MAGDNNNFESEKNLRRSNCETVTFLKVIQYIFVYCNAKFFEISKLPDNRKFLAMQ